MANNNVKDWAEFNKLAELQKLEELVFVGESVASSQAFSLIESVTRHSTTSEIIRMQQIAVYNSVVRR